MALSDVSLRCKAMSGLGATADIGRRCGLGSSVAFDPNRKPVARAKTTYRIAEAGSDADGRDVFVRTFP